MANKRARLVELIFLSGRTAESLQDELRRRKAERKGFVSLSERLKKEIEALKKSKEILEGKFADLEAAHLDLLRKQEHAFDSDLTGSLRGSAVHMLA